MNAIFCIYGDDDDDDGVGNGGSGGGVLGRNSIPFIHNSLFVQFFFLPSLFRFYSFSFEFQSGFFRFFSLTSSTFSLSSLSILTNAHIFTSTFWTVLWLEKRESFFYFSPVLHKIGIMWVYVCGFVTAFYNTQQTLAFKPKNNQTQIS